MTKEREKEQMKKIFSYKNNDYCYEILNGEVHNRKLTSSKQATAEEMDIFLAKMICKTTEDTVFEEVLDEIQYMRESQEEDEFRDLEKLH
jgi:hypothetical protein